MIVITEKVQVSQLVFRFLQGHHLGEILLVTSRGVYLSFPGQILMLTQAAYGVTPIGVGLQCSAAVFSKLDLQIGQPVRLQENTLTFPGGSLSLQAQAVPAQSTFSPPLPSQIRETAQMLWQQHNPKGVAGLCKPLLLGQSTTLTPLCQVALPLIKKLLAALQGGHQAHAQQAVAQLIGLGIGLTPSLDDVLLGMLYALLRWGDPRADLLKEGIQAYASKATHPISAAYLLAVADDAPFQRLDDMLTHLTAQTPIDLTPILEIGSSSGSEMLLGLLLAAELHTQTGGTLWNILP